TFLGMALISSLSSSICIMITKQNVQLQEKDRMLLNAEKETMRANLMRAMSHDLRTPLTSIIGSSSTYLAQEEYMSPEEKRKLVRNIEEDAQWLLNMVENLLSVTRIQDEKGVASVVKADESLEEVISESVQRFRKRFPDVQVRVSIPDSVIIIPMDATLIEQVINNLLENALFHSGTNGPIDLVAASEKSGLSVSIKDYGKGIAPELLDTIFDGGGTSENHTGDGHKGMGIGLSICKTIINAHGGEIHAGNHLRGAQFTFTLPDWREY
ncbi:sensor histidine kinase, partial [Enterocloster bolteae]